MQNTDKDSGSVFLSDREMNIDKWLALCKTELTYEPKKNLHVYDNVTISYLDYFYDVKADEANPQQIFKRCFTTLYEDGRLLEAIYLNLVQYAGVGQDGCWWFYLDDDDEGFDIQTPVYYCIGFDEPPSEVHLTEHENFVFVQQACERFWQIHPDKEILLKDILVKWQPKYS